MSGKAYTMQEMKRIVEYLTERRAYGEIRGRKMWMDYANSKLTNRTWQSLKETFLKRILPDIHNPYYKLSMYQIASFREGQDVEEKLKNKLEIREVTAETSKANLEKDEHASSSKKTNGEVKGEGPIDSKVDRDSTETLVLNNSYDTTEDIKRDLTSPTDEKVDNTKTLRDLIEFEPMTPEAQRVIDDFDTDGESSDGELRMEIDLKESGVNSGNTNEAPIALSDSSGNTNEAPIALSDSDKQVITKSTGDNDIQTDIQSAGNKSTIDPQVTKPQNEDISQTNNPQVSNNDEAIGENKNIDKDNKEAVIKENTKTNVINENTKSTLNTSETIALTNSTIPDSILPNNQEELNKDDKKNKSKALSLNKRGNEKTTPVKRKNPIEVHSDGDKQPKTSKTESDNEKTHANTEAVVNVSDSGEIEQDIEINKNVTSDNNKLSQSSENPCLQSVSLYDAQLAETKNNETESSLDLIQELVKNPDKASARKVIPEKNNDVVVLKSHSESITSYTESSDRGHIITKRSRDNALANVFGFTSGSVRSKNIYRKRSLSHQQSIEVDSESSNWTSDSAPEYVSPPRGRRIRQTKKFLKPKSARVSSLEKNGGLFVVYNNKIYPLVKDGKIVKNHVNYISDGDSDEDRNSWKLKYLEEKKKSAELQKLLHRVQENEIGHCRTSEPVCAARCDSLVKSSHSTCQIHGNHESKSTGRRKQETDQEEKPVKIKFTKNNEEVQLEGPLSYITPALAQVMQLLYNTELPQNTERNTRVPAAVTDSGSSSSLMAINLDDEVQEKVNKIEEDIFKEIEEQDKIDNTGADVQDNVTKRNRLRRKTSTTSASNSKSPAKKPRVEQKEDKSQKIREEDVTTSADVEGETSVKTTRKTRMSSIKEANKSEANTSTRKSLSRKQAEPKTEVELTNAKVEEDSDIRYKFPSGPPSEKKAQGRNKKTPQKKLNSTTAKTLTLPYNLSYSSESMQGYQDSDISPAKICLKRRRPSYSTTRHNKIKNSYANKKSTSVTRVPFDVYESSNSFQDIKESITFHNSTLATEIYKSDSYQLLMPINVPTSKKNAIHTKNTIGFRNTVGDLNLKSRGSNERITPNFDNPNAEGFSSSNVSLPTSPVLSIVENMSISRSLLTSVDDLPADDQDPVGMYKSNQIMLNNLMSSDLDAPMPLMEQECKITAEHDDGFNYHYNMQVQNTLTPSSQSLINKLNTVNIEDQTLSVNARLKNLVLDSNKKNRDNLLKKNTRAVHENNQEDNNIQKGKTKKRSSTPRRRPTTRKVAKSLGEPLIEEEHMETCSCVSRRSCPAVLSTNEPEATEDTNKDKQTKTKLVKDKKKKDVIKVKIIKPKVKPNANSNYKLHNTCSHLVVNDPKADLLQQSDNSIDLIHNHSDTCLQAQECIGDSVEIIENSCSVVSVNSERSGKSCNLPILNMDEKIAEELYNTNARYGIEQDTQMDTFIEAECPDTFHTPPGPISSAASLMTEDLSVEIPETTPPRCTKWWLLSEDENSNSNNVDVNQNVIIKEVGYGADLNVLFPVTCAVPDLSTITEFSKENDGDTRSNLNSPLPNV